MLQSVEIDCLILYRLFLESNWKQLEATGNTQRYNAFPFMFPTSQNSTIIEVMSDSPQKLQGIYTLDGRKVEKADKGIYIIDGKRIAKR